MVVYRLNLVLVAAGGLVVAFPHPLSLSFLFFFFFFFGDASVHTSVSVFPSYDRE